ncbi:MAG: L-threonylcarbamoyladenylate synthase [Bryobacteraceae bacterium]
MARTISPISIDAAQLARAAELIRRGELVAFPTETVYGLGANALDADAVARIFEAKGRPSTSPLIVHVDGIERAGAVVRSWPDQAETLARRFWPGPLTLVLPKQAAIPALVTAGLDTVGIRVPNHPVALALLREAGVPIAAPSANRFTQLSPTTAEHVRESLGDRVSLILDGGPANVGIESTVLSLGPAPVLLRPGMITRAQIEALIGPVALAEDPPSGPHQSPGQHRKHYSPRTPLAFAENGKLPAGRGAYLYWHRVLPAVRVYRMPADPETSAARLYDILHELDGQSWDWIAVEHPPCGVGWEAIADRLNRAAAR